MLDGGTVSAFGTHEELLETNAIYQEVYAVPDRRAAATSTMDADEKGMTMMATKKTPETPGAAAG